MRVDSPYFWPLPRVLPKINCFRLYVCRTPLSCPFPGSHPSLSGATRPQLHRDRSLSVWNTSCVYNGAESQKIRKIENSLSVLQIGRVSPKILPQLKTRVIGELGLSKRHFAVDAPKLFALNMTFRVEYSAHAILATVACCCCCFFSHLFAFQ